MAHLSTHVLDTSNGRPAAGVSLTLTRLEPDGTRTRLAETHTNADGRTDRPLLSGDAFTAGTYEIEFRIGDYFRTQGLEPTFLDTVPLRFGVADPATKYHVPLLVSPWSYSTYRGS
ncbi:MAG TPA: hydroxyisourate hydrolase [Lichenihabitans sp.]|jgi:5-hydroxyisourate hydrolase|nr:hydroxyisourate hydrolase [Lichenihabitans sp.]